MKGKKYLPSSRGHEQTTFPSKKGAQRKTISVGIVEEERRVETRSQNSSPLITTTKMLVPTPRLNQRKMRQEKRNQPSVQNPLPTKHRPSSSSSLGGRGSAVRRCPDRGENEASALCEIPQRRKNKKKRTNIDDESVDFDGLDLT